MKNNFFRTQGFLKQIVLVKTQNPNIMITIPSLSIVKESKIMEVDVRTILALLSVTPKDLFKYHKSGRRSRSVSNGV